MNFEAAYYEADSFWANGMIEDAANIKRLTETCNLIPVDTKRLLDAGCGNGVFAKLVKSRLPEIHVTCVDRSAKALEYVEADEKRLSGVDSLPFEDKRFDCVTCLEVIEHLNVTDFENTLNELTRVASKFVIISVPFNERIEKNVDQCPGCQTVFNRDLHLRRFSESTFKTLLDDRGFRLDQHMFPVPVSHYFGFRSYFAFKRLLSGSHSGGRTFLSPICPLCGYEPESSGSIDVAVPRINTQSNLNFDPVEKSGIKNVIKSVWPKKTEPGYWILGRFQRCTV